jgi:hypothetical protein
MYTIQAFIAKRGSFPLRLPEPLVLLELDQDIQMIPIGESVQKRFGISDLPLMDDENTELPAPLLELCGELSSSGKIAYIEAEIFGGVGTQAYVYAETGKLSSAVVGDRAINAALRLLGVVSKPGFDEFDSVGLGRSRSVEGWLNRTTAQ